MNQYIKSELYQFKKTLNHQEASSLKSKLAVVDGVESISFSEEQIEVNFSILKITAGAILEIINNLGYPAQIKTLKRAGILKRFVESLARSNRKTFGDKKLDCCELKHE